MMCRCLKVSRSGYYAWLGREPSRTVRRRKELSALIEWVFNSSRGTYGYRRTHAAGARRGVETSPDTVRSIMRSQGLEAAQPRRKVRTTVPAADLGSRPDLVRRGLPPPTGRESRWVGDTHLYPHPGGARSAWRPSPGCCTKKAVGYATGATARGTDPWCARRSIWRPAGARTRQGGDGIPLGPGVPVHLRAALPASGEICGNQ